MPFITKQPKAKQQAFDIITTLGIQKKFVSGVVGLEIEVEGSKLPKYEEVPQKWLYHVDNSLRGNDNGEYVLKAPIAFSDVPKTLEILWDSFKKNGSKLDRSNRTSIHVHLNVQKFYLNRLTSLMALYFIFEEILAEWCGEHRVGNLFCLRAKDAPAIISQIRRFIKTDMQSPLREHLHYAALNAHALAKFGSLEFRTMRGVTDVETIQTWVNILRRLYDISADFKDPRDVMSDMSGQGSMAFFDTILGEYASVIRKDLPWTEEQLRNSIYEGVRFAQDLCYCRDWELFQGIELQADPFGRNPQMVAQKVKQAFQTQEHLQQMEAMFEPGGGDIDTPMPPTVPLGQW